MKELVLIVVNNELVLLSCSIIQFCSINMTAPEMIFNAFPYLYNFSNIPLQNLIMQHVDHSAGDLIDLLQGLLRYDPSERLKAKEALRHPFFFTRDTKRYGYPL